MATIDQQFVEFIVKSLVGNPDKVEIKRTIDEKGVLLELTVAQEDLGRVIGKRGATAQSIRTLLRALGTKNEARYNLKIVDPEGDSRPSRDYEQKPADDSEADNKPVDEDAKQDNKDEITEESVDEKVDDNDEEVVEKDKEEESMVDRHRRDLEDLDD